jgi:hypothetical protein
MTNLNRRGSLSVTSIEATMSFDSVFTDEVSYTYPATYIQQRSVHVFECPWLCMADCVLESQLI